MNESQRHLLRGAGDFLPSSEIGRPRLFWDADGAHARMAHETGVLFLRGPLIHIFLFRVHPRPFEVLLRMSDRIR